jgi:hypothetical protein
MKKIKTIMNQTGNLLYIKFYNDQSQWLTEITSNDYDNQNPHHKFRETNYSALYAEILEFLIFLKKNKFNDKDSEEEKKLFLKNVIISKILFEEFRSKIKFEITSFQVKYPLYNYVIISDKK